MLSASAAEELTMSTCFPLRPRTRTLLDAVGMSQTCHERKCATAIGASQPVQVPRTEAAKRKAARRMRSLELSIYSARLSSMESVEHKKERREPLFFGFIGKDATDHRRPYTSRTPGRSTPNAGRNRKKRRSVPRARCLLAPRGTRP